MAVDFIFITANDIGYFINNAFHLLVMWPETKMLLTILFQSLENTIPCSQLETKSNMLLKPYKDKNLKWKTVAIIVIFNPNVIQAYLFLCRAFIFQN